jgi:predicted DNA-binding protein YlxM (UPF0122 family)
MKPTFEQVRKMQSYHEKGLNFKEIAKLMDMEYKKVYYHLNKFWDELSIYGDKMNRK